MSRPRQLTWLLMVILLYGLTACGARTPTIDSSLAITQIWQTVEVAQTMTALSASPTPSMTTTPAISPSAQGTSTLLLINTPLPGTPLPGVPSTTPSTTSTPAGTQSSALDNAIGVTDVTYPDGSEVPAGTPFIKTWRVKNLGPSVWDQDFSIIFGWGGQGTNWSTTRPSYFTATVQPGETIDISVTLTAPTIAGNYTAAFRLQNDKGYNFGPPQTVVVIVK
jgi:hypothetical protein